jgi:hypothetical protein
MKLEQLSYDIACFILPHYVYEDFPKLEHMLRQMPGGSGAFFYYMACRHRDVNPRNEPANHYKWHHGLVDTGIEYFALEYPKPKPVDMSGLSLDEIMSKKKDIVLAPHFSAIILRQSSDRIEYFILGQAPVEGATTLRRVDLEVNANLGRGPEPKLDLFIQACAATGD